ncbi:sugar phosphate isomerase/epimerase [bacterium]|nr:sugar phosphate isomerase/epimerase [bacterium]
MPARAGRLPHNWRLGTTSCIYEEPLLANVRRLAGRTEDIELILYDGEWGSNWPALGELEELLALSQQFGLSYTVHIPSAMGPVSCDASWEERSYALVGRTIERLEALSPFAYVWHWESECWGKLPSMDLSRWREAVGRLAQRVAQARWVLPRRLAVETLSYPFDLVADFVQAHDYGMTLDIGHLWQGGFDWERAVGLYGERTGVVHLHGVIPESSRDHHSLKYQPPEQLRRLGELLSRLDTSRPRVLTLEVFSEADWLESEACLVQAWPSA